MNNYKTKEIIMNKLKTIGVSALCGSLAAVSAQAGEIAVTGSANVTYTGKSGNVNGQPLGLGTALAFAGSGELDNGSAVGVNIYHDDQNVFSSADIYVDVAGFGKVTFDQGGGTGLDRLDDKMPTAWEESYDAGAGSNIVTVTGVGGGMDMEVAVSGDMLPEGTSLYISYAPGAAGGSANDKATTGVLGGQAGSGYDVVVEQAVGTASVFAGISKIDMNGSQTDRNQHAYGLTVTAGMVTAGYQKSRDGLGSLTVAHYDNDAFGVSFVVNDNLSVSFAEHESQKYTAEGDANSTLEVSSLQAAYTMGGATFKIARSEVTNGSYSTAANQDYDVNVVGLSLAF
jgi:outer membrane protein OmpU